jgi:hypothetical protein
MVHAIKGTEGMKLIRTLLIVVFVGFAAGYETYKK